MTDASKIPTIVGIDPDLTVFEGYDTKLHSAAIALNEYWDDGYEEMSRAEKLSLADAVIARWQRYRIAVAGAQEQGGDDALTVSQLASLLLALPEEQQGLEVRIEDDCTYFPVQAPALVYLNDDYHDYDDQSYKDGVMQDITCETGRPYISLTEPAR